MKTRLFIAALLVVAFTTGSGAVDVKLDAKKLQEIKASTKILQDPALEIVDVIDKVSVYFLKLKATSPKGSRIINAFLDKKTGAIYFGNGFDKEGTPLAFPKEPKQIKEGVSFTYGTGTKDLYLVTDPECPYCSKFAKASEGKLGDYKIHVIFLPLSFHKKAPAMIEWILQGKNNIERKERYDQIALKNSTEYKTLISDTKNSFKYTPETQEIIDKSFIAVQELDTRGTPAVYDAEFRQIPLGSLLNGGPEVNASKK